MEKRKPLIWCGAAKVWVAATQDKKTANAKNLDVEFLSVSMSKSPFLLFRFRG